ncbi:protein piccolo-like isoform X2 [Sycon ciliatum]|uniref:protein piccolo-like isoform X2 n=1 Tax=Sycon ciliatum TaxID=27933 RepID=UPI0031F5F5A1
MSAGASAVPPSAAAATNGDTAPAVALPECEVEEKANACTEEFLSSFYDGEIPHCVPEPPSSRYLPTIVARMIISELKQDEHCKGIDLLAELARIGTASLEYIVAGLDLVLEETPDLESDIPHIYDLLASVIGAIVFTCNLRIPTLSVLAFKHLRDAGQADIFMVKVYKAIAEKKVLRPSAKPQMPHQPTGAQSAMPADYYPGFPAYVAPSNYAFSWGVAVAAPTVACLSGVKPMRTSGARSETDPPATGMRRSSSSSSSDAPTAKATVIVSPAAATLILGSAYGPPHILGATPPGYVQFPGTSPQYGVVPQIHPTQHAMPATLLPGQQPPTHYSQLHQLQYMTQQQPAAVATAGIPTPQASGVAHHHQQQPPLPHHQQQAAWQQQAALQQQLQHQHQSQGATATGHLCPSPPQQLQHQHQPQGATGHCQPSPPQQHQQHHQQQQQQKTPQPPSSGESSAQPTPGRSTVQHRRLSHAVTLKNPNTGKDLTDEIVSPAAATLILGSAYGPPHILGATPPGYVQFPGTSPQYGDVPQIHPTQHAMPATLLPGQQPPTHYSQQHQLQYMTRQQPAAVATAGIPTPQASGVAHHHQQQPPLPHHQQQAAWQQQAALQQQLQHQHQSQGATATGHLCPSPPQQLQHQHQPQGATGHCQPSPPQQHQQHHQQQQQQKTPQPPYSGESSAQPTPGRSTVQHRRLSHAVTLKNPNTGKDLTDEAQRPSTKPQVPHQPTGAQSAMPANFHQGFTVHMAPGNAVSGGIAVTAAAAVASTSDAKPMRTSGARSKTDPPATGMRRSSSSSSNAPAAKATVVWTSESAEGSAAKSITAASVVSDKPSTEASAGKSAEVSAAKPAEVSTAKSAEASAAKSAEAPAAKSAEKPTGNEWVAKSAEVPIAKSAEAPAGKSTEAPAVTSAEAPASKSAEAPAEKSTETLAVKSAGVANAKPSYASVVYDAVVPAVKSAKAPASKPSKAPASKPSKAPASKPSKAPASKPSKAPIAKSAEVSKSKSDEAMGAKTRERRATTQTTSTDPRQMSSPIGGAALYARGAPRAVVAGKKNMQSDVKPGFLPRTTVFLKDCSPATACATMSDAATHEERSTQQSPDQSPAGSPPGSPADSPEPMVRVSKGKSAKSFRHRELPDSDPLTGYKDKPAREEAKPESKKGAKKTKQQQKPAPEQQQTEPAPEPTWDEKDDRELVADLPTSLLGNVAGPEPVQSDSKTAKPGTPSDEKKILKTVVPGIRYPDEDMWRPDNPEGRKSYDGIYLRQFSGYADLPANLPVEVEISRRLSFAAASAVSLQSPNPKSHQDQSGESSVPPPPSQGGRGSSGGRQGRTSRSSVSSQSSRKTVTLQMDTTAAAKLESKKGAKKAKQQQKPAPEQQQTGAAPEPTWDEKDDRELVADLPTSLPGNVAGPEPVQSDSKTAKPGTPSDEEKILKTVVPGIRCPDEDMWRPDNPEGRESYNRSFVRQISGRVDLPGNLPRGVENIQRGGAAHGEDKPKKLNEVHQEAKAAENAGAAAAAMPRSSSSHSERNSSHGGSRSHSGRNTNAEGDGWQTALPRQRSEPDRLRGTSQCAALSHRTDDTMSLGPSGLSFGGQGSMGGTSGSAPLDVERGNRYASLAAADPVRSPEQRVNDSSTASSRRTGSTSLSHGSAAPHPSANRTSCTDQVVRGGPPPPGSPRDVRKEIPDLDRSLSMPGGALAVSQPAAAAMNSDTAPAVAEVEKKARALTEVNVPDAGEPLQKSSNRWKPTCEKKTEGSSDAETQAVLSRMMTILNELTPEKFEKLAMAFDELEINSEERLRGVVELICKKSLSEPTYCELYARICLRIADLEVPAIAGGEALSLRKVLLTKCQKEFYSRDSAFADLEKKHLSDADKLSSEDLKQKTAEYESEVSVLKKNSLGNIKFIGQLFMLRFLTKTVIYWCLRKLLAAGDEHSLELMCELFETTGGGIDRKNAKTRIPEYVHKIGRIIKKKPGIKGVSTRTRILLEELVSKLKRLRAYCREDNKPPPGPRDVRKDIPDIDRSLSMPGGALAVSQAAAAAMNSDTAPAVAEVEKKARVLTEDFFSNPDAGEVRLCVADINSPISHPAIVSTMITCALEMKDKQCKLVADLFTELVPDGTIKLECIVAGLYRVLEETPDLALDIPHIYDLLVIVIVPLVFNCKLKIFTLSELVVKHLRDVGKAAVFMVKVLKAIAEKKGEFVARQLCGTAYLKWSSLLQDGQNVDQFLADQGVQFLDCPSLPDFQEDSYNRPRGRDVKDWIDRTYQDTTTASFAEDCASRIACAFIDPTTREFANAKCETLLILGISRYFEHDPDLRYAVILGLEKVAAQYDHHPGMLQSLFDAFYSGDASDAKAFFKWEAMATPTGDDCLHGVALNSVKQFLAFLHSAYPDH